VQHCDETHICCSSRQMSSVAMTSSQQPALTSSSTSSVTSPYFELRKPTAVSVDSFLSDTLAPPPLPPPPFDHHAGLLTWRQHPGSPPLNPAAFLDYIRLINLQHSFDKVAGLHQLAAGSGGVWSVAAQLMDGPTSKTTADVDDAPASVVRPAVVRPIPLQPFASAATQRHRLHDSPSVQSSSSSSLKLWRPAAMRSGGSRDRAPPGCGGSAVPHCGDSTPPPRPFLPPPPSVVLFPPPPSPSLHQPLPADQLGRVSSSSTSPWLSRNCAGLLSAVMHRQVVAAAAAVADRAGSFPSVSGGPAPPLPTQRQLDVLSAAASRLSAPAAPAARLPTPPSNCAGSKRLFSCPQCRYLTDRKNNLKRHVSTMHHESDKQLECCTIVFKSKASLRDHVLIFHGSGYQCRHCGRNFCRKALLKRHLTVHSGQKDYVCARCDYATSHKSNLERHKKVNI